MMSVLKPRNSGKYCEFHKKNDHTIAECCELKKSLHKPADKAKIDAFFVEEIVSTRKMGVMPDVGQRWTAQKSMPLSPEDTPRESPLWCRRPNCAGPSR